MLQVRIVQEFSNFDLIYIIETSCHYFLHYIISLLHYIICWLLQVVVCVASLQMFHNKYLCSLKCECEFIIIYFFSESMLLLLYVSREYFICFILYLLLFIFTLMEIDIRIARFQLMTCFHHLSQKYVAHVRGRILESIPEECTISSVP